MNGAFQLSNLGPFSRTQSVSHTTRSNVQLVEILVFKLNEREKK